MASFSSPISSKNPAGHVLQEQPLTQSQADIEKAQDVFKKSPKARLLVPELQRTASQPKLFPGTCVECATKIEDTVHRTIENMDFDGLKPYLKVINLIERGDLSSEEWIVDAENKAAGGICLGMSLAHLKNIQDEHGIEGSLAVEKDKLQEFHHAAVIIECEDGLVFIDNRATPKMRLFPIKFNSTFEGKGFSITVPPRGTTPPLIFNWPENRLEYYTDISNGADVVNKQFMPYAITNFIPIAVYKKDGDTLKDIIITPKESKIRLKNYNTQEKQYVSFETIRQGGLQLKLEEFMGSDFHTTPQVANDEIVKFVSYADKMIELFT